MNLRLSYISNSEYGDIKKFLKKLLALSLLIFVLDKGLAFWAAQAVLHEIGEFGSLAVLYRGDVNSQIVLFGTSKTNVNIDAGAIEQQTGMACYNLAIANATVETHELLFEEFLIRNKKPDIVFMEADFTQFRNEAIRRNVHGPVFRSDLLAPFSTVSPSIAKRLNPTPADRLAFWFFRCKNFTAGDRINVLFRSMFRYAIGVFGGSDSQNQTRQSGAAVGFQDNYQRRESRGAFLLAPLEKEKLSEERIADWRGDRGTMGISPVMALEPQETYVRIVDFAKSKGIQLVLYGPPFFGKLDEDYAKKVDMFFAQLAEQNEHVHYWSFRDDHDLRADDTLWNDSIHMNWNGAAVLTQKIIENLRSLRE